VEDVLWPQVFLGALSKIRIGMSQAVDVVAILCVW
jgi:hypothetical protein